MTLADTSVWVDHLRHGNSRLAHLLEQGAVVSHPFVVGELACGNLARRAQLLTLLQSLPEVTVAAHEEVLALLAARELHGRGLGWIDVHLLAASILSGTPIWTLDRKLDGVAHMLGVSRR